MITSIFVFFAIIFLVSFLVTVFDIITIRKNKELIFLIKDRMILFRIYLAVLLLIASCTFALCAVFFK